MKRLAGILIAGLTALPVLLSWGPSATAGELLGDVYVVRPGDTLSEIAARELGDAKLWREILRANPQVRNEALIFPGDTLAMPLQQEGDVISVSEGAEQFPSEPYEPIPVAPPAEEAAAPAEPVVPELPVQIVRPKPVVNDNIYRTAGYVTADLPQIPVVATFASKVSYVEGDEIIVGSPAEEGQVFTVVRPTKKVYHPVSGEFLGWVIRVLGWAEITCRGDQTSRALLTTTVDSVEVGDFVVPFDPDDIPDENHLGGKQTVFCEKNVSGGFIVATRGTAATLGEGDIVYLDQARDQGVQEGDQFIVTRKVTPDQVHVIGQLQVLKVGEKTSSALVINSIREIAVADSVQPMEPTQADSSGS